MIYYIKTFSDLYGFISSNSCLSVHKNIWSLYPMYFAIISTADLGNWIWVIFDLAFFVSTNILMLEYYILMMLQSFWLYLLFLLPIGWKITRNVKCFPFLNVEFIVLLSMSYSLGKLNIKQNTKSETFPTI